MYNQSQSLDSILKYLIDNNEEYVVHSAQDIAANALPELEPELVYFLLNKIVDFDRMVITSSVQNRDVHNYKANFEANTLTRQFLAEGGFIKRQEEQELLKIKRKKIEKEERKLRKETLILNKWNKIFLIINAVISFITIIISIYTFFNS